MSQLTVDALGACFLICVLAAPAAPGTARWLRARMPHVVRHGGSVRQERRPRAARAERAGLDWLPDDQRSARGHLVLWDGEAELGPLDVERVDYDPREGAR